MKVMWHFFFTAACFVSSRFCSQNVCYIHVYKEVVMVERAVWKTNSVCCGLREHGASNGLYLENKETLSADELRSQIKPTRSSYVKAFASVGDQQAIHIA